ncbi:MAG TPA: septal ring lytic transglycosylase RlpA family protein [Noviherbaspirillum sp.]|uniref:septal ring lytic transglycosylase RlpA family protein n=1 Tax=Noviherbaspirillum sp. TaxID=1926288 RepID=UPI002D31EAF0|nr:septal ring lytic transglycosylase RlpA family protein [Noviherbaspirillum sp.]HYD97494.1 septal ring lytic transglycosylase RlpA family protein [Noviherbaspirillum sp.]
MLSGNHGLWRRHAAQLLALLLPPLALTGCGSAPTVTPPPAETPPAARPAPKAPSGLPALPPAGSGRGGYYMDDGPGENPPEGLLDTPDAEPRIEPYSTRANRPYTVFGKTYTPSVEDVPFRQRGVGSWYGRKFHGQKTSSGEPYDMYKMTAAHPTLPIPSYARVTNLANGRQVIVRINDRGPFHSGRIIDLSYTAALKLGYLGSGSSELEVERLLPQEIARMGKGKADAVPGTAMVTPVSLAGPEAPRPLAPLPAAQPAAAPAGAAAPGQGFYLQLGAFGQRANAEAIRNRVLQSGAVSLPAMEIVESKPYFRLYSGPFATREEAAAAAQRLQQSGPYKPMIVQR